MENNAFVRSLLPEDAPLSTMRIVTASKLGVPQLRSMAAGAGNGNGASKAAVA